MDSVMRYLNSAWQFTDYCINHAPGSALCEVFWSRTIICVVAIGALAVLVGAVKYAAYRRRYHAAIREQWLREQADEAGIREVLWTGERTMAPDMPDEEILKLAKAGIEKRRQEARSE